MKKKALLSIVIAALLALSPVLAGCSSGGGETTTAAVTTVIADATTAVAETDAVTTDLNAKNLLGEADFGGEKVVFYTRSYNGEWTSDLLYDTVTGEIIKDAVATRNLRLQSQYKFEFEEKKSGAQSFYTTAEKQIAAGTPDFDVLYTSIRDAGMLAADGYLLELGSVPNLSLGSSWWSPFLTKQLTIANKNYYATGEITTIDDVSIRAVFFNKEMLSSLDGGIDLYGLVDSDGWTLEEMFKLVNKAYVDVGEDGRIELGVDSIGLLAEGTLGYQLLMGTGEKIVSKDADDIPYVSITGSRPVDVVDWLTSKIAGNNAVQTGSSVYIPFAGGGILFALVTIVRESSLKTYDIDFGIVPYPKYNNDQQKYHCYSDSYCPNAISFPFNLPEDRLARASFVCEAMAIESVETVTPAFYDICMKTRFSKDVRMGDMLDIIRDDYMIDLADVYLSVWGLRTPVTNAISNGNALASTLRSTISAAEKKIGRTVDAIKSVEH